MVKKIFLGNSSLPKKKEKEKTIAGHDGHCARQPIRVALVKI